MADPDADASEEQRQITQELRFYSASMSDFINENLSPTTTGSARSIGLKRFSRFHPFDDDALYGKKMPIYQRLLRVAITNGKTHAQDASCDSDTSSCPSTSDRGDDDALAGPPAHRREDNVIRTQPDAAEDDDVWENEGPSARVNGPPPVERAPTIVPTLPPVPAAEPRMDAIEAASLNVALEHSARGVDDIRRVVGPEDELHLQESALRSNDEQLAKKLESTIFGSDDDDAIDGDDKGEEEMEGTPVTMEMEGTPVTMRVFCSAHPFSYDVSGNIDLVTITGGDVLAMVAVMDASFDASKHDLGFHPGCSSTLTMFDPTKPIAHYGYTDPAQQALSIFGRKVSAATKARKAKRPSKLKAIHKCRVQKCPGHANNQGHIVCSNDGCTRQVTETCYLTLLVPTHKLVTTPGVSYCTKTCYLAGNKKANKQHLAWDKDGQMGVTDPNHSMSFLIGWLTVPGNVSKWRGSRDNAGKTKHNISCLVADHINKQGVR